MSARFPCWGSYSQKLEFNKLARIPGLTMLSSKIWDDGANDGVANCRHRNAASFKSESSVGAAVGAGGRGGAKRRKCEKQEMERRDNE